MILTGTFTTPSHQTLYERRVIEQLTYSNYYIPTESHYPIRLLRIREKHLVPSNYRGREWYLCPGCEHVFIEEFGDYSYTYHPHGLNLNSSFIKFDRKKWKKAVHCCSKECLLKEATKFAIKSVTKQGKIVIRTRKIRSDIREAIEKFH